MDTSKVNNIQDKILQSIEIVLNERLQSVEFDTTILCTILDDSEREKGKYQVTNGNITFTAYSDDTRYRKNNEVYVLIPEGNYDNQKVILSKKTNDTVESVMVTSPFDSIVDVSGNILPKSEIEEGKLLANSSEKYRIEPEQQQHIAKAIELYNSADSASPIGVDGMRLGLKANFKSYIGNAVSGHYGILLEMVVEKEAKQNQDEVVVEENQNQLEMVAEENQNQVVKENKTRTISFGIDSSEMIGNPYDFESFYTQEKVYDLEKEGITKIHSIKVIFYQNADFLDRAGYALDCSESGFKRENGKTSIDKNGDWELNQPSEDGISDMFFEPNLFVEDIYLCLGQDIKKYENDFIELYTNDDKTYDGGEEKNIGMHWIYVDEGVKINLGTASEERIKKEGIKEIRWYKYEMGQTADAYSGFNWVRINPDIPKDEKGEKDKNKSILKLINNYWCYENGTQLTTIELDSIKLMRQCKFYPRGTKNTEQLKVIIIQKKDDQEYVETYRSNTFVLTNNKQVVDAAQGTVERTSINVAPSDDSNGIYTIYGKNYSIVDTITNVKNSELVASFDFEGNGNYAEIADVDLAGLTWTIPAESTMIDLNDSEKEIKAGEEQDSVVPIIDNERIIAYQIKRRNRIKYRPAMQYNPGYNNNVITCSYVYQGHEYIFNYTMYFGISGTMGTDSTLTIRFADNRVNCIDLTDSSKAEYELILQMNDSNNQSVNIAGKEDIEWRWFNGDKYSSDIASIINLAKKDEKTPFKATITLPKDIDKSQIDQIKNKLFIVQASIGELVTYFPIPIKVNKIDVNKDVDYITGPSQVIYQSDGNIHYMNQAYSLYPALSEGTAEERQRIEWRLIFDYLKANGYDEVENSSEEEFNAGLYYIKSGNDYIWCDPEEKEYNSETQYFVVKTIAYSCYRDVRDIKQEFKPFENENIEINDTELNKYAIFLPNLEEDGTLIPLATYIKEAPVFGVQAVVINEKYNGYNWEYDSTEETLWTQPVLTIQNKYPSTSIDNWSGKGIQMDESQGTIMSAAIAAGRKNSDNTFSGVILGDWREGESALTEHTGIYGFSNGEMSYSFAEDGTAFIGKASSGRIYFDGNKSTIYSAEWNEDLESEYSDSYDIIDKDAGAMCIDLNRPSMYLVYPEENNENNNSEENKTIYKTIHLDASKNGKIIPPPEDPSKIEENEICLSRNENNEVEINHIEKAPFKIGSNFCVDWDGNLVAKNGQLAGTIYADAGQIGGWSIDEKRLYGDNISLQGYTKDANSNKPIELFNIEESSHLVLGEMNEELEHMVLAGSIYSYWNTPFGQSGRVFTEEENSTLIDGQSFGLNKYIQKKVTLEQIARDTRSNGNRLIRPLYYWKFFISNNNEYITVTPIETTEYIDGKIKTYYNKLQVNIKFNFNDNNMPKLKIKWYSSEELSIENMFVPYISGIKEYFDSTDCYYNWFAYDGKNDEKEENKQMKLTDLEDNVIAIPSSPMGMSTNEFWKKSGDSYIFKGGGQVTWSITVDEDIMLFNEGKTVCYIPIFKPEYTIRNGYEVSNEEDYETLVKYYFNGNTMGNSLWFYRNGQALVTETYDGAHVFMNKALLSASDIKLGGKIDIYDAEVGFENIDNQIVYPRNYMGSIGYLSISPFFGFNSYGGDTTWKGKYGGTGYSGIGMMYLYDSENAPIPSALGSGSYRLIKLDDSGIYLSFNGQWGININSSGVFVFETDPAKNTVTNYDLLGFFRPSTTSN